MTNPPLHAVVRKLSDRIADLVEERIDGPAGNVFHRLPPADRRAAVDPWVKTLADALERDDLRRALERADVYGQAHGLAGSSAWAVIGGSLALQRAAVDALTGVHPAVPADEIRRATLALCRLSARIAVAWAQASADQRRRHPPAAPPDAHHAPFDAGSSDALAAPSAGLQALAPVITATRASLVAAVRADMTAAAAPADDSPLGPRVAFLEAALCHGVTAGRPVAAFMPARLYGRWIGKDAATEERLLEVLAFCRAVESTIAEHREAGGDQMRPLARTAEQVVVGAISGFAERLGGGVRTFSPGPPRPGDRPPGRPPAVAVALLPPTYLRTRAVGRSA